MLQTAAGMRQLGTETAFEVLARAQALAASGRDIINLGIGQPDFKTPDHIVEAAVKALRDGHHGYTPANGIPALRTAVAARPPSTPRGDRRPGPGAGGAGRKGDHVVRHPDVRRAGCRDPLPQPRLPDLRVGDPVHRRHPGSDPAARGERLRLRCRGSAGPDHGAHPPADRQQPRQPDRRRRAAGAVRPAGGRARRPSPGGGAVRRDLQPDALRRARACLPDRLRPPGRPGDPARRGGRRPMR